MPESTYNELSASSREVLISIASKARRFARRMRLNPWLIVVTDRSKIELSEDADAVTEMNLDALL